MCGLRIGRRRGLRLPRSIAAPDCGSLICQRTGSPTSAEATRCISSRSRATGCSSWPATRPVCQAPSMQQPKPASLMLLYRRSVVNRFRLQRQHARVGRSGLVRLLLDGCAITSCGGARDSGAGGGFGAAGRRVARAGNGAHGVGLATGGVGVRSPGGERVRGLGRRPLRWASTAVGSGCWTAHLPERPLRRGHLLHPGVDGRDGALPGRQQLQSQRSTL